MKKYFLVILCALFASPMLANKSARQPVIQEPKVAIAPDPDAVENLAYAGVNSSGKSLFINAVILDPEDFLVMSYNVRRKGKDPEEHQWDKRKQLIFDEVLSKRPAIIGFQEVVKGQQFEDLKKGLPGYESFGDSRNEHSTLFSLSWLISKHWNAQNECSPIFYDPKQVTLMNYDKNKPASGTFGINPWMLSKQLLPRVCTWGLFSIPFGEQFYFYNAHLDNKSETTRSQQLKMIFDHRKKLLEKDKMSLEFSTILTGDFNTKIEGDIKKIITENGFVEAREIAKTKKGPEETRTGWNDNELKKIDHILVKNLDVAEYEVVENPEGVYPSDHRPVIAKILR